MHAQEEIAQQDGLLRPYEFPIELQELRTAGGLLSNRKAVVRTDTNQLIADVSNTYQLVEHKYLFDLADDYMKKFGQPEVKFHSTKGGAHMIGEYTFKDIGTEVVKGDVVGLKLFFHNSYRGDASIKLGVAGLRLSCLNGMCAHDNEFNIAFRHTKTHIEDGKFRNLDLPSPEKVVRQFNESSKEWAKLAAKELTEGEISIFLNQAIKDGIITKAILDNPYELEENSAWGLYNLLTHWISHKERASAQMSGKIFRLNRIDKWFAESFTH